MLCNVRSIRQVLRISDFSFLDKPFLIKLDERSWSLCISEEHSGIFLRVKPPILNLTEVVKFFHLQGTVMAAAFRSCCIYLHSSAGLALNHSQSVQHLVSECRVTQARSFVSNLETGRQVLVLFGKTFFLPSGLGYCSRFFSLDEEKLNSLSCFCSFP